MAPAAKSAKKLKRMAWRHSIIASLQQNNKHMASAAWHQRHGMAWHRALVTPPDGMASAA